VIDLSWTIDPDHEADLTDPPRPLLSTWNYLRSSLRRRRRLVAGLGVLGAIVGLGLVMLIPPGSTATVTILLAHPSSMGGPDRGAMDLSLLATRSVSARTVQALGLPLTPEAFGATVTAVPVTPDVLTIKVSAPDDSSAVARGQELVRQYLTFRAAQLTSLSSGLQSEYTTRIRVAQQEAASLTKRFEQLSAQGAQGASQGFDVLARRSDLNRKIADWQETIDTATLQTEAALKTTHVIDPVHAERSSTKRALALAGVSGLVAGSALGVGIVFFQALVSERLRRRRDIGIALGASVRLSVRSRGPQDREAGLRRLLPARTAWRDNDLAVLVHGLELVLEGQGPGGRAAIRDLPGSSRESAKGVVVTGGGAPPPSNRKARSNENGHGSDTRAVTTADEADPFSASEAKTLQSSCSSTWVAPLGRDAGRGRGPSRGVALAAIGNPRAAADVLTETATVLREQGANVFMVDLSKQGSLAGGSGQQRAGVHQPTGIPQIARGPRGAGERARIDLPGDSWRADWDSADVVLALVEVDPGIEVEHIATWVDEVVPLVTAGAATAELLSTTGDLVREAGFRLPFAMMVGCDATDESLGLIEPRVEVVPAGDRVAVGSTG
jgi:hypothetical protein